MQRLTPGGGTPRAVRHCHGEDVRMAKVAATANRASRSSKAWTVCAAARPSKYRTRPAPRRPSSRLPPMRATATCTSKAPASRWRRMQLCGPSDALVPDYKLMQKRIGTTRNVVVTPSTYGTGNSVLRQYPKSKQKAPPERAHRRMKMKAGDAERSGPLGFVLDGDIRNNGCSRGHPGIIPGLAGRRHSPA
jgi:hypothetical protein